jgi:adenosylcobinamide kinase / adenosylcobinamide-phosphate guanylyltransferase
VPATGDPVSPDGFRRIFVTGGARSGKSTFAERLATECGEPVAYVATATVTDDEMAERIRLHQARRPRSWRTLEAPLGEFDVDARTILFEDLTLLLSNLMLRGRELEAPAIVERLVCSQAHVIIVSNEVGMGIVPSLPLGRAFRDALGRLNQLAAARCTEAYFLVAGLPLKLK